MFLKSTFLVLSFIFLGGALIYFMPSSFLEQTRQDRMKSKKIDNTNINLEHLTDEQYRVTQKDGTEQPFQNQYWDHKETGIYVDVVSGQALFSSLDKYDSGTGWPSFTKPIDSDEIKKKADMKLGYKRVELRSRGADSHLGHIFDDGPEDKGGKRFCINSSALKFIPYEDLEKEGYGRYKHLFQKKNTARDTNTHTNTQYEKQQTAILAGGCFWGVEHLFKKLDGVIDTTVGYIGGTPKNPTYSSISTGTTGHAEAVEIKFDPSKVSYRKILEYFFRLHDPTQLNRQGHDVGTQYRSAIFFVNEKQKSVAEDALKEFDNSKVFKNKAVTQIVKATQFHKAEDYHQDYLQKTGGYCSHILRDR